jgi:hypothetical protein
VGEDVDRQGPQARGARPAPGAVSHPASDTRKDSAREIREYFIPDFSNWKNHDSYQEAFQRLISDLKASDSKPK